MTGLDKIIKQIENESNNNSAKIISAADAKSSEIIATAQAKADKITAEYDEKIKHEVSSILSRAESANALNIKKNILQKKQELIKTAIDNAENSLYDLADKDYFELILKVVTKYAPKKSGTMLFNQKDLARLPANFEASVNQALNSDSEKITISKDTVDIQGGFILNYGGIEENCSFKALFESAADELSDKVHALLFE